MLFQRCKAVVVGVGGRLAGIGQGHFRQFQKRRLIYEKSESEKRFRIPSEFSPPSAAAPEKEEPRRRGEKGRKKLRVYANRPRQQQLDGEQQSCADPRKN